MRVLTTNDPVMEADGDLIKLGDLGGEYTLPKASASTLGGVKVGDNLTIEGDGTLNADAQSYTLPPATDEVLGGVKIGSGVTVAEDGTISVEGGGGGGFTAFEWTVVSDKANSVQIVENNSIRIGDVLIVAISLYLTANLSQYDDIIENESIIRGDISNRNVCIRATASPASNATPSSKNMYARTKGTSPYCLVIAAGESISVSSYPYLTICGVLMLKDRYIQEA